MYKAFLILYLEDRERGFKSFYRSGSLEEKLSSRVLQIVTDEVGDNQKNYLWFMGFLK